MVASPVAFVVDADVAELRKTEHALEEAGFVVMTADSFAQAKALLASMTPEIVIADIKLQAYNGLHLAALCAVWRPGTPFIATHSTYDAVLDADAKRLSAAYVVKTSTREELAKTALTMLESRRHGGDIRRSYRKPAPVPTVVQVAASSAEVVDVSYGGVQLKLPSPEAGPPKHDPPFAFDIVFPNLDISLHAARIWAMPDSDSGGWFCGADISGNDSHQLQRWRDFVDSVG
jgi:DNA-binding response OmpR family regulator